MSMHAGEFSKLDQSPNAAGWVQMMLDLPEKSPSINIMRQMMLEPILAANCQRVLDGGSGPGVVTIDMARQLPDTAEVIGMDMSENMLTYARGLPAPDSVSFIEGSLCDIPFESNYFDAVRVERVLQHIPNTLDAIREMVRVCKPGGLIVACESDVRRIYIHPVTPAASATFAQQYCGHQAAGHIAAFLPELLKEAGAVIEKSATLSMTIGDLMSGEAGVATINELKAVLKAENHTDQIAALDKALENSDAYLDMPMAVVVARKPGG